MREIQTGITLGTDKVIYRETDPKIIDSIRCMFVPDQAYSNDVMANEFSRMMVFDPDNIYVFTGYYKEVMVAFLIAHTVGDRNYALLAQAWSYANRIDAQIGLGVILDWCKEKGLSELRYETSNDIARLMGTKRYGFSTLGVIMSKKVS